MNAQEHDRIRESISAWLDGELPANEAERMAAHVAGCAACGRTVAAVRGVVEAAAKLRVAEPSADFTREVLARVEPRPAGRPRFALAPSMLVLFLALTAAVAWKTHPELLGGEPRRTLSDFAARPVETVLRREPAMEPAGPAPGQDPGAYAVTGTLAERKRDGSPDTGNEAMSASRPEAEAAPAAIVAVAEPPAMPPAAPAPDMARETKSLAPAVVAAPPAATPSLQKKETAVAPDAGSAAAPVAKSRARQFETAAPTAPAQSLAAASSASAPAGRKPADGPATAVARNDARDKAAPAPRPAPVAADAFAADPASPHLAASLEGEAELAAAFAEDAAADDAESRHEPARDAGGAHGAVAARSAAPRAAVEIEASYAAPAAKPSARGGTPLHDPKMEFVLRVDAACLTGVVTLINERRMTSYLQSDAGSRYEIQLSARPDEAGELFRTLEGRFRTGDAIENGVLIKEIRPR